MHGLAVDCIAAPTLDFRSFRDDTTKSRTGAAMVTRSPAHEFNNLMTTILGYATLVLDSMSADDPRRLDVNEIVAAVQRAIPLAAQLTGPQRASACSVERQQRDIILGTTERGA